MSLPGVTAAYLFTGPLMAGLVVAAILLWEPLWRGDLFLDAGAFPTWGTSLGLLLLMSYVFGVIPAALTGAIVARLSPYLPTLSYFLLASVLIGATVSALLIGALSMFTSIFILEVVVAFAGLGAVAGLGSGALALWLWRA